MSEFSVTYIIDCSNSYIFTIKYYDLVFQYTLGEQMCIDKWKEYIKGLESTNYFIISSGYDLADSDIIRTIFPLIYRQQYIDVIQKIIDGLEK